MIGQAAHLQSMVGKVAGMAQQDLQEKSSLARMQVPTV
jgi:hypothetical protein